MPPTPNKLEKGKVNNDIVTEKEDYSGNPLIIMFNLVSE